MTYKDLQELTGQESGIIMFADNNIIVCNWSHTQGIPRVLEPMCLIGLPQDIICGSVDDVGSISDYLSDDTEYTVLHDDTPDGIAAELESGDTGATVYHITAGDDDIIVIAPKGWA